MMFFIKRSFILLPIVLLFIAGCHRDNRKEASEDTTRRPNIVYILADDMGYGDVSVYNPESKIQTPHIDKMAKKGMRFTDAHSASSVCTPSRYSILTGRYCWRSRLPKGVLRGYGRALIEKNQLTIASFLKKQHYSTAVIGKWHLGLNWVLKEGHEADIKIDPNNSDHAKIVQDVNYKHIDFSQPVTDGPREHGFDYSYILPASLDMPPYCYVRNDTLTAPLTNWTEGSNLHPKGTPLYAIKDFWRPGLMAQGFDFQQVLPHFTTQAVDYINKQANAGKPFFLYFAMPAPHTPWLPSEKTRGRSNAGMYGDYVMEVDAMVGRVMDAIQKNGIASNTIIIFTSDNGPYWRPSFIDKYNHHAAYVWRGMKADIWEGGHRVPFIAQWKGTIQEGTESTVTTTLANLLATCSDLLTGKKQVKSAIDSYSILPALLGKKESDKIPQIVINESSQGMFAVRNGPWKLIRGLGSGGFSSPKWKEPRPNGPKGQLYNLYKDSAEQNNVYLQYPDKVNKMMHLMDSIKNLGTHSLIP